ncbi:MAG: alpha/beta fold hydrolase, partial [Sciscionella sp.]
PERIAGLVLLAPAITGAPESVLCAHERRLGELIDNATAAGDLDEANRYETWFWLDGPGQPEGRVSGAARELALEMNRTILGHGDEDEFDESVDAWNRLGELALPVTVAVGEHDASFIVQRARQLTAGIVGATYGELSGTAHLPYLDQPELVVRTVRTALG